MCSGIVPARVRGVKLLLQHGMDKLHILGGLAALGGLFFAFPASAATISNGGGSTVVIVVVEDGSKVEIALDSGASETICPAGCFITLPNGDRVGLAGDETIELGDGGAVIK